VGDGVNDATDTHQKNGCGLWAL